MKFQPTRRTLTVGSLAGWFVKDLKRDRWIKGRKYQVFFRLVLGWFVGEIWGRPTKRRSNKETHAQKEEKEICLR